MLQDDSGDVIRVVLAWSGDGFSGSEAMVRQAPYWFGTVGPVPYPGKANLGGKLTVTATAYTAQGAKFELTGGPVTVLRCPPPIIG